MEDLHSAPPAELMRSTRTALLLLDLENRFFWTERGGPSLPTVSIIPAITQVLAAARTHGVLRIFIHVIPGLAMDSGAWRRRKMMFRKELPGLSSAYSDWGEEFAEPFQPQKDELVVSKVRTSAFYCTPLEAYLHNQGIETLVLVGVASNGAVLATALDALVRDFYTLVVTDATLGTTPPLHEAALSIIGEDNWLDSVTACDVWSTKEG